MKRKIGNYIIKKDDTLMGIAIKHRMSIGELRQLNGFSTSNRIFEGEKIKIKTNEFEENNNIENNIIITDMNEKEIIIQDEDDMVIIDQQENNIKNEIIDINENENKENKIKNIFNLNLFSSNNKKKEDDNNIKENIDEINNNNNNNNSDNDENDDNDDDNNIDDSLKKTIIKSSSFQFLKKLLTNDDPDEEEYTDITTNNDTNTDTDTNNVNNKNNDNNNNLWKIRRKSYSHENLEKIEEESFFPLLIGLSGDYQKILSDEMIKKIIPSLPPNLRRNNWRLLYSIILHGSSMHSYYLKCRYEPNTLLVVKNTKGEIFGAFAAGSEWHISQNYFGSGESFLWRFQDINKMVNDVKEEVRKRKESEDLYAEQQKINNNQSPPPPPPILNLPTPTIDSPNLNNNSKKRKDNIIYHTFKWSGANNYFLHASDDQIGIGGGGIGFGLLIYDDFMSGSTVTCDTFCNAPLCKNSNFEIDEFEIWSFTQSKTIKDAEREAKRLSIRKQTAHNYYNRIDYLKANR